MEDAWLTWAKRLQSIASTGLHFSQDRYDRERYEEIAHIANEMLGRLGSVPIQRIENLISDFAKGYATPKVDVRGAVFHENRILLVREASDGLWTLLASSRMWACRLRVCRPSRPLEPSGTTSRRRSRAGTNRLALLASIEKGMNRAILVLWPSS